MSDLEQTFADLLQVVELETDHARPGEKPGWVYFVACPATMRLKIGHTKGNVYARLAALQTGSASPLRLMAKQPGTIDTERSLHTRFAKQRVQGEWFEVSGEILAYMWAVVWVMTRLSLKSGDDIEPWMLCGLRMFEDQGGPLPDDLHALIADEPVH
jgi:hypothetical protein